MFLTLRKNKQWVFFILAVLFLAAGYTLYRSQILSLTSDAPVAEQSTEFAGTEALTEEATSESFTEEAFMESFPEETTSESSTEFATETESEMLSGPERSAKILPFLAYGGLFAGTVFGILFLCFSLQKRPLLGPETEVLLLALLVFFHTGTITRILTTQFIWNLVSAMLLLTTLRGLLGWICCRCTLSFCLPYRIGMYLSREAQKPHIFLFIHVLWGCCTALLSFLLINERVFQFTSTGFFLAMRTIFFQAIGYLFLFWTLLCILSFIKFGYALTRLHTQFSHFTEGQPVSVQAGIFERTEHALLLLQEKHQQAIQTAVTSERFKVELISNVSHDLRTPLTSILGYGELLQKENLSSEGKQQLDCLNQKAAYMSDLVESLFELTKVSSGVHACKKEAIDLIKLLEQTIGLFDDQLTQAGFTLRRHYEAAACPVITDGSRMHAVFANLLGNAIKYALPGTRIYLEVKEIGDDYHIRMTNTASYDMDFEPEEMLQRFARGDKARSTKGSGIGLAIAQTYTESVGGSFHISIDGDQFNAIVTLPKPNIERNL